MEYHGHKLLEEHMLSDFMNLKGRTIIEIGSVREHMEGQNSTGFFMEFCKIHDMKLISVDMDPECTQNVHDEAKKLNFTNYEAVTSKGEDYLESIESFDYLYLDGFDYDHQWHTKKRRDKYTDILNVELTDENSWKSHLDMVKAVYKKGLKHSLLCIDDVISNVKGKGCTAVPFLLQSNEGWKAGEHKYNAVIFNR